MPPFFSFSDAETTKNISQYLVGGYLASDGAEMVESITEVDSHKVGRSAVFESTMDIVEGLLHTLHRLVVADIGEEHIAFVRYLAADNVEHSGTKFRKTHTVLRRNVE